MGGRITPLRALVGVQLAVLAIAGLATVFSLSRFTQDEIAHFSYLQSVAEDQRIPTVGEDLVTPQAEAIYEGVYPAPGTIDRGRRGLGGQSYEAFQPPAFYVVAAPAFLAGGGDYVRKLRLVRLFDLALLLGCAALLWLLARRVAADDEDPLGLYALGLTVLLWPGVVLRAVTVSNAGLEMLLALTLTVVLWDAWARRDPRRLLFAALVFGLGLLTRLSLVSFAPSLAIVTVAVLRAAPLPTARRLAVAAGVAAIPVALLLPWLAWNVHTYDALTASVQVRALQESIINPTGADWGFADLPAFVRKLSRGVLAEEWWIEYLSSAKRIAGEVFFALLAVVPLAAMLRVDALRRRRLLVLAALPVGATLAWMAYGLVVGDWDFFLPRYLYPSLMVYGLLAAVGLRRVLGSDRRLAWLAAAMTLVLVVIWARVATVEPFTG